MMITQCLQNFISVLIATASIGPTRAIGESHHIRGARTHPHMQSEVSTVPEVKSAIKFDEQLLERKLIILNERELKSKRQKSSKSSKNDSSRSKSSKRYSSKSKSSKSDSSRSKSSNSKSESRSSKSDSSRSKSSRSDSSRSDSYQSDPSRDGSASEDLRTRTSNGTPVFFSYSHSEDFGIDDDFTTFEAGSANLPRKTFHGSDVYLSRETFRGSDVVEDFVAEGDGSTVLTGTVAPCENYSPSMRIAVIKDIAGLLSGFDIIADSTSPQADALKFILAEEGNCPESKFLQRYAVAVLYYSLGGIFWDNNENYMSSSHECDWYGITCNEEKIIMELDLSANFLFGLIPNEISLLSSLSNVDLSENSIFGSITPSISLLKMLASLYLNDNNLVGEIPEDIYGMKSLRSFHVDQNYLSGTISSSVGNLVAIEDMIIW
eukprot:CAMPEP_0194310480 /NCGR_PEP_ID=MMETSP0171-20130528/7439_1 /TAXON_ID=218684 /ORGANISM="Corethron pennatum, Strain L29A3" /LENGTH=434 /DNA_ID=CAMNT_0039064145 /DNA_START=109 /DNA_END=1410 /DNA_ORIENTATION=-